MIKTFQTLCKTFVFSREYSDQIPVGVLLDAVIDPEKGKIRGFWVKTPEGKKILDPENIIEWKDDVVFIHSEKDFFDPEEGARLQEVFRKEVPILNNTVWNRKKVVGEVYDFTFDTISLFLLQIFVQKGFWWWGKQQIIHRSKIVKITKKGIFISENSIRSLDSVEVFDSLVRSSVEVEKNASTLGLKGCEK